MSRTIYLIRHLPTDGTPAGRIDKHEHASWLRSEMDQGIVPGSAVAQALSDAVAESSHLVVSPLARAQGTAAAVLATLPSDHMPPLAVTMADVREAPLPVVAAARLRASTDVWDSVCRVAWLLGYSGGVESRSAAAARARRAATKLDELSQDGPVTVIGHGFFNIMLARPLRRLGWIGPRLPSHGNGAVTRFARRSPVGGPNGKGGSNPPASRDNEPR